MRIILYTGKGGVGKTSIAAQSAVKLAKEGKKVLVMSTDPAHSLGDSFDKKLGRKPLQVADGLDALEIDTVYETERAWGNLKDYMKDFLTSKGQGGIQVEELLVFPGLEELFSLFKILDIYDEGQYDVLIVDCAPTGETLSMLKYPELLSSFIRKVLPSKRKAVKVAGPAVEKITKIPMPKDNVFDDIEYMMQKMERLQLLMLDKSIVSLRIVTTPEQIVIKEAKRNFTCLNLFNYNVDAIIINRIYPEKAMEGYFSRWLEMQKRGLDEIAESFSEVPKFYQELQKKEVRTLPVLEALSQKLFQNVDISKVLFEKQIYKAEKFQGKGSLTVYMPHASKMELRLEQDGDELILGLKNENRRFLLPKELIGMEVTRAKLEDGYLKIEFREA